MSKELTNIMEGVVGSTEYIKSLNGREDFSCIITQNDKYNYYDMIKELCTRINSAFEEIYDDLGFKNNNQASIVRHIPSDKRKKVVEFINNISKIGDSVGYSFGKKRDIISIL